LIIGAAKCGTTSLHYYLDRHPDIAMSTPKEPQHFTLAAWEERLPEYETLFDPSARFRGESSTDYTRYPVWQDVPRRIHSVIPDVKMIYLVGDPVARVVSHYVHLYSIMLENRGFSTVLQDYDQPANPYVAASRYATQLEQYLKHFPLHNILVLDQHALRHEREHTLREIFKFLGVATDVQLTGLHTELNVGLGKERLTPGAARIWFSLVGPALHRVPGPTGSKLARAIARGLPHAEVGRPKLDPRTEANLTALLRDEVEHLRELTGKPFDRWPSMQEQAVY
jgi:hypothetical protein